MNKMTTIGMWCAECEEWRTEGILYNTASLAGKCTIGAGGAVEDVENMEVVDEDYDHMNCLVCGAEMIDA